MHSITAKIIRKKIVQCDFQMPFALKSGFSLNAALETKLRKPKEENEHTIMFDVTFVGSSPDYEEFKIILKAHFIFEYPETSEDIDSLAKNVYVPAASNQLYNDLDDILKCLGYPPFKLTEQDWNESAE